MHEVFYVFQVCIISHNCQDPTYLSLLRIMKMKTVMKLHQHSESRTCPGKAAPLGQGFANLDLLAVSRIFHRPAWPTFWWKQDRRQQRGRDGKGVLSTGLRSGNEEDWGEGWASEPGSCPGRKAVPWREAVPGSHWPSRRPSPPQDAPSESDLASQLRDEATSGQLSKHGWVHAAAELPGTDPSTKPAGQCDQVTGSRGSVRGRRAGSYLPACSGGFDLPLLV